MRVTIDIADTPTSSAPIEIRVPEQGIVSATTAGEIGGGVPGAVPQYDGGADMGTPLPPEPAAETATLQPSAQAPGTAQDGGAAPDTAGTSSGQRLPSQIDASAQLSGESAAD